MTHLPDLGDLAAEPAQGRRLHAFADPAVERGDHRTGERRGWRHRCRHARGAGVRAAHRTECRQRALRRRLIDRRVIGRSVAQIRRRGAAGRKYGVVRDIVGRRDARRIKRRRLAGRHLGRDRPCGRMIAIALAAHSAWAQWSQAARSRAAPAPSACFRSGSARLAPAPAVRNAARSPASAAGRGPIRDTRRRTQFVGIAHGRAFAQQRHLEREIGAAHARAFDRLHLLDADADLDRARFQAGDLGLVPPDRTLAMQEAAPATGERQQQHRAGKIGTDATLHTRENASSFFNETSMLR